MSKRADGDLLNHPYRLRIMEVIAAKGSASFSDIRKETSLSTGTIYHHLSLLGDYVIQGKDRRYSLTSRGIQALASRGGALIPQTARPPEYPRLLSSVLRATSLAFLMERMGRKYLSIATITASLVIGMYGHRLLNTNVVLLTVPAKVWLNPVFSVLITGWLPLWLLGALLSFISIGIVSAIPPLGGAVALAMLPIHFFPNLLRVLGPSWAFLIVPLQLWSGLLYASALISGGRVRNEIAVTATLSVLFLSALIIILSAQKPLPA